MHVLISDRYQAKYVANDDGASIASRWQGSRCIGGIITNAEYHRA